MLDVTRNSLSKVPVWVWALFIVTLGIVIRLIGIEGNEIALDEPHTLFYSNASLDYINEVIPTGNNPVGHYYLMHYWIEIFGHDVWMLRLPGLLAIACAGVFMFLIGRLLSGNIMGIMASAMYTLSMFVMVFAHEVRAYPFVLLFTVVSFYALLKYKDRREFRFLVIIGVSNALSLYFHFIGLVWCLVQVILVFTWFKNIPRSLIWSVVIFLVLYAPNIPQFINSFSNVESSGTWIDEKPKLDMVYSMIRKFSNSPVAAVVMLLSIVMGSVVAFKDTFNRTQLTLLTATFGSFLLIYAISFFAALHLDRYMLFIVVPFFLLVAHSMVILKDAIKGRFGLLLLLLPIVVMGIDFKWFVDNDRELDKLADRVADYSDVNNRIVIISPDWITIRVMFHVDEEMFWDWKSFNDRVRQQRVFPVSSSEQLPVLNGPESVLLVDGGMHMTDPDYHIKNKLDSIYGPADSVWTSKAYSLNYYSKQ